MIDFEPFMKQIPATVKFEIFVGMIGISFGMVFLVAGFLQLAGCVAAWVRR